MSKKIVILLIFFSVFSSLSMQAALNSKVLCQNVDKKEFFRKMLSDSKQSLGFRNSGGLLNEGVCWWHSRFTRNALYLAIFEPNNVRQNSSERRQIIKDIRRGKKIVKINGYSSLQNFSFDNKELIQEELEKWQVVDGVIGQQWLTGLFGSNKIKPSRLKKKMDKLFKYVVKKDNVAYVKVQVKGIDAHAWLVLDMKKTSDGYRLLVVDSNSPNSTRTLYYYEGKGSIYDSWYGNVVPYLGREAEMRRLKRVVSKFCR